MAEGIMSLPKCSTHGEQMILRERVTEDQNFCGTWYDCPKCENSVLFPSKELTSFLDGFRHNDGSK